MKSLSSPIPSTIRTSIIIILVNGLTNLLGSFYSILSEFYVNTEIYPFGKRKKLLSVVVFFSAKLQNSA